MCNTGTRGARPSIALSSENKWGRTLIEPPCPNYLDLNKETGAMGEHCQFHQRLALQPQCVEIHQQMHWQVSTLLLPVPCLGTFHRLTTSEERGTQVWGLWVHKACQQTAVLPVEDSYTWGSQYLWTLCTGGACCCPQTFSLSCKRKVSGIGFHLPGVHAPRWVSSQILVLQLPHFLHALTQNSKDLEKSTNSCDS